MHMCNAESCALQSNISVVAALVAEDDVLLLEAAAEADVEVLVPPKVLGNAVSATVADPGVQVLTALAVLDIDEDIACRWHTGGHRR
jgi:hypothetical protein